EHAWTPVGEGFDSRFPISVETFAVYDDGAGAALYAGGAFETPGGVLVNNTARWDGASWAPLDQGVYGGVVAPVVSALTVYDAGSGDELFAGGRFTVAGSAAARQMARWDGASWRAVGGLGVATWVGVFEVFDDGAGPGFYVGGGRMSSAGGVPVNSIARWDVGPWRP